LRFITQKAYNAGAMIALDLPDEAATCALAARISRLAQLGDIIALRGDLGTGKTTFARAFIRARGDPAEEIPSPTFTLVQIYELHPPIWHFDLYRLGQPEEAWELGIEEAFSDGISLIEWPERLSTLLPERRLEVFFSFCRLPDARRVILDPSEGWRPRLAAITEDA
jgi:tRNA threonylcarbamoyladenosine biosynthesis protein TsaE